MYTDKNRWHLLDNAMFFLLIVCIVAGSRWLPHPPNITAVGSVGLFAGSQWRHLGGARILLSLVGALFISDVLIGFYDPRLMIFVYAASLLSVPIGFMLPAVKPWSATPVVCLFGAAVFFALSNFGVWLLSDLYPLTMDGLLICYIAAIPFFAYSCLGNLIYLPIFLLAHRALLRVVRKAPARSPLA